jgi:NAD(P)H-hydrate epimerase
VYIYTAEEMKAIDANTVMGNEDKSLELMENAAKSIYQILSDRIAGKKKHKNMLVVCGKGNNGGDGLALARMLGNDGFNVKVLIAATESILSRDAAIELKRLKISNDDILFLHNTEKSKLEEIINESDLIIDAIFGTGFKGEIGEDLWVVIEEINKSKAAVISVDIPSGLDGNTGRASEKAVKADYTIVVDSLKTGNLLGEAADYNGEIIVGDDIGLDKSHAPVDKILLSGKIAGKMKKRKASGHKYDFGNLVVAGGSVGMTGAPLISAKAGLESGCGLSTVLIGKEAYGHCHSPWPEVMIKPYENEEDFDLLIEKASAVVFGPGLGMDEKYDKILLRILKKQLPVVVDADGILRLNRIRDQLILKEQNLILTPHCGEMAKLFRVKTKDVLNNPIYFVKSAVECYNAVVVLKGPCTLVGDKSGLWFFYKPNSGMATGGSGDVLAGIIGGLNAQGYNVLESAKKGVVIHGNAGNMAKIEKNEWGMCATDIINNIYKGIEPLI